MNLNIPKTKEAAAPEKGYGLNFCSVTPITEFDNAQVLLSAIY